MSEVSLNIPANTNTAPIPESAGKGELYDAVLQAETIPEVEKIIFKSRSWIERMMMSPQELAEYMNQVRAQQEEIFQEIQKRAA